ncbi:MAG TPA: hypothetical protein DCP92_10620 [Nitrospiraceae bacterium]|jgi:hypothetical protein|nr:hypothetical protein [Nitrospiraceae bacterium]
MRLLKYFIRNATVINLILLSVLVAGGAYIISPLLGMNIGYTPPPLKKAEPVQEQQVAQTQVPSPLDFSIIAEQNLFHPDRTIPVEKVAAPPLPQPEFVLYGILITDDAGVAYLEDKKAPLNTPGRGKRQLPLRKGETLSGFTLKEIETDKVVMVRGEEQTLVYLNDQHKPKTRESDQTTAAAAAPGQQPSHVQQQPGVAPTRPQQERTASIGSSPASQMPTTVSQPQVPMTVSQPQAQTTVSQPQAAAVAPQQTVEPPGPSNMKSAPAPTQRMGPGLLFGTQGK